LNYAANTAEASVLVTQHFHLVDAVDNLRRLLNLLIDNFYSSVVGTIRVLFELNAVVDQKVHEALFLLRWQK